MAIAGFVLGLAAVLFDLLFFTVFAAPTMGMVYVTLMFLLAAFFISIVGIVLSAISIKKSTGRRRALAITGLVAAVLALVLFVICAIYWVIVMIAVAVGEGLGNQTAALLLLAV